MMNQEITQDQNKIAQLEKAFATIKSIREEMNRIVIGQSEVIDEVLTALLAEGHILLEGVPGLGKTLLVRTLANCFSGQFARIQFTPDLMPSDITGHAIYDLKNATFTLQKGPIFTNLLLADEINRAPAKTQAALLEVMQERQATIEGKSEAVPHPFMVLATQNSLEQEGTYPLPEAQLDRFMFKILMTYPDLENEISLVNKVINAQYGDILQASKAPSILTPESILELQALTREIFIDQRVVQYAVDIVRSTRESHLLTAGAGPRASISLIQGARAKAMLKGALFVTPDDVKECVLPTLRHRVERSAEMEIEDIPCDEILKQLLAQVEAPRL